jgi:hypothetical protein
MRPHYPGNLPALVVPPVNPQIAAAIPGQAGDIPAVVHSRQLIMLNDAPFAHTAATLLKLQIDEFPLICYEGVEQNLGFGAASECCIDLHEFTAGMTAAQALAYIQAAADDAANLKVASPGIYWTWRIYTRHESVEHLWTGAPAALQYCVWFERRYPTKDGTESHRATAILDTDAMMNSDHPADLAWNVIGQAYESRFWPGERNIDIFPARHGPVQRAVMPLGPTAIPITDDQEWFWPRPG